MFQAEVMTELMHEYAGLSRWSQARAAPSEKPEQGVSPGRAAGNSAGAWRLRIAVAVAIQDVVKNRTSPGRGEVQHLDCVDLRPVRAVHIRLDYRLKRYYSALRESAPRNILTRDLFHRTGGPEIDVQVDFRGPVGVRDRRSGEGVRHYPHRPPIRLEIGLRLGWVMGHPVGMNKDVFVFRISSHRRQIDKNTVARVTDRDRAGAINRNAIGFP